MLKEKVEALQLPTAKARRDMLELLYSQEYGFPPPAPERVWAEELACNENAWAG